MPRIPWAFRDMQREASCGWQWREAGHRKRARPGLCTLAVCVQTIIMPAAQARGKAHLRLKAGSSEKRHMHLWLPRMPWALVGMHNMKAACGQHAGGTTCRRQAVTTSWPAAGNGAWRYGHREHGCPRALKAKAAHAGCQTYVAAWDSSSRPARQAGPRDCRWMCTGIDGRWQRREHAGGGEQCWPLCRGAAEGPQCGAPKSG